MGNAVLADRFGHYLEEASDPRGRQILQKKPIFFWPIVVKQAVRKSRVFPFYAD